MSTPRIQKISGNPTNPTKMKEMLQKKSKDETTQMLTLTKSREQP